MSATALELEEVVFADEANVHKFRHGDPPPLVDKFYVSREGYYVDDETSRLYNFYLHKSAVWSRKCGEPGHFDTEEEARRVLAGSGRSAIARGS